MNISVPGNITPQELLPPEEDMRRPTGPQSTTSTMNGNPQKDLHLIATLATTC
jgi:hypothetical protein